MQIENLSHTEALTALQHNTRYDKLVDLLYLDPLRSFIELMSRAQKFIRLDEAWQSLRPQNRFIKK